MFTGPVGPVEVYFYWPEAVLGNFYWPGAIGSPLALSPGVVGYDLCCDGPLLLCVCKLVLWVGVWLRLTCVTIFTSLLVCGRSVEQGLSRNASSVSFGHAEHFFDSLDTQKFMSEFAEDDFS